MVALPIPITLGNHGIVALVETFAIIDFISPLRFTFRHVFGKIPSAGRPDLVDPMKANPKLSTSSSTAIDVYQLSVHMT